ncbi:hypothetical protein NS115_05440 [Paenibacillus jamilae]|uniref:Uncharacterized protein n=1 Tax=Paenibacillus jamilae TaxID=114136 RepID=A0ACC4ZYR4_9BACL|nr:hypothetical protein C0638_03670 [Paenibacillus sp. lzh-N1]KTS83973.1 hypothetical protein NS115_05440 [Paenibacillus jamilae]
MGMVVLRGPLRVWKVLTIAVAARFQDWINPLQGWNPAAKANASLLQNPFTRCVPQVCSILQQCLYLFCSHREEDR